MKVRVPGSVEGDSRFVLTSVHKTLIFCSDHLPLSRRHWPSRPRFSFRTSMTASSSRPSSTASVRVWDLPTRLFHWVLLTLVIGLVASGQIGGVWLDWHARFGYGVLTLLLFRLIWGVVGGHHSRFVHFIPSPKRLLATLRQGLNRPSLGHNPLGALSVVALLMVLLLQALSGMASDDEIAFSGPLASKVSSSVVSLATWYHKGIGKPLLIGLVILHVLAIVYHRRRHGERLVAAMVCGDKTLPAELAALAPASRDGLPERLVALVCLLLSAGVVLSVVSWGNQP